MLQTEDRETNAFLRQSETRTPEDLHGMEAEEVGADAPRGTLPLGNRRAVIEMDVALKIESAVRALATLASGIEDTSGLFVRRTDSIAVKLQEVADAIRATHRGRGVKIAGLSRTRLRKQLVDHVLERIAERGTKELAIEALPGGGATVRFEGDIVVDLSRREAVFLEILAEDTGKSRDGLVGWKTEKKVIAKLENRLGRRYKTTGALNNLVYVLRGKLRNRGVNPYLVQRGPEGLRFALRKRRRSPRRKVARGVKPAPASRQAPV
jgi:hypothetical protein